MLTQERVMTEVQNAVRSHQQVAKWHTAEEARKQVLDASNSRAIPLEYPKSSS